MKKKNFFKDHDNQSVVKNIDSEFINEILATWNKEVPEHVKHFNDYEEDRNSVIYFALFVEFHINKILELLFPDFDSFLDLYKTATSMKINILASFRLFPKQIFESCRCINNIRNEFAHEFSITKIDQLENLSEKRKKITLDKLRNLTDNYEGDYEYEKIEDTIINRFKSLCLNTITAFRIYEPHVRKLRSNCIDK
jgi:hypothetical protein